MRERRYFCSMSLFYEREAVYARHAWSCLEDRSTDLEALIKAQEARITVQEAQITTLQIQHGKIEWQRQEAGDMVTKAFGRIHALEARDPAHPDDLEDTGSSVADALVEYEQTKSSRNGDDSHDSGSGRRRTEHTTRALYTSFSKSWHVLGGDWFTRDLMKVEKYVVGLTDMIQGHYKKDCPKLKNKNRGNEARNGEARAKAYAMGNSGTNPDSNVVTGMFLLNNRYASILFDTGTDRSFMSTTFSSLIDIFPTALDHDYDVKLADGKIIGVNTIIWGCTLNFLNHPFTQKKLMPVYNMIIHEPFGNEILIVRGDRSNSGHKSQLNIISCTKTQKYLQKGCHDFLAHVTTKKAEDKSKEKRLEDVPIVRYFLKVFPKDLSGIPPTRQVEFQIDLIPDAAPVAQCWEIYCKRLNTGSITVKLVVFVMMKHQTMKMHQTLVAPKQQQQVISSIKTASQYQNPSPKEGGYDYMGYEMEHYLSTLTNESLEVIQNGNSRREFQHWKELSLFEYFHSKLAAQIQVLKKGKEG
ncbi:hypothetical protein Tco_0184268 [Tanacetum coccineum]